MSKVFQEGDRVNLGAMKCVRVSHYDAPTWDREGTATKWRYVFIAPTGERFVYTGLWLGKLAGMYVDMRATIKRLEPMYNCIRLARVKVISIAPEKERTLV